ncbi:MAG: caspase family protein [Muribaculaceae bacterium]|nr:caspase family protein [Muribaculaceae bacterium]
MGNRFFISLLTILIMSQYAFAEKRALLVGIGKYDTKNTGWSVIHGDDDAERMRHALIKNGVKAENITVLKNREATKDAIVGALKGLAARCKPGDQVLFLFSGHGQPISDLNGDERKKPFDEAIVPYDACRTRRYKKGSAYYNGERHLADDELNYLLDGIKRKLGSRGYLFVAFDACFSEGLEMAKSMIEKEDVEKIGPIRGTSDILRISRNSKVAKNPIPRQFSKGARIAVVSACRDNERNYEYRDPATKRVYGSLAYCLLKLTSKGIDFKRWERFFDDKKYEDWNVFMSEQHPTIKVYD